MVNDRFRICIHQIHWFLLTLTHTKCTLACHVYMCMRKLMCIDMPTDDGDACLPAHDIRYRNKMSRSHQYMKSNEFAMYWDRMHERKREGERDRNRYFYWHTYSHFPVSVEWDIDRAIHKRSILANLISAATNFSIDCWESKYIYLVVVAVVIIIVLFSVVILFVFFNQIFIQTREHTYTS